MPTPYRTPKRVNGDIPPGNAVGVGQLPPKKFERGDPLTASQMRDIAEQASRPNQLQRTMPGLNFSTFTGNPEFKMPNLFFEGILLEDMRASTDPFDDPVVVKMKVIKPLNHKVDSGQDALSFADIGDEVYVTNRALDISGSEGDRILCVSVSGELRPTGGGGAIGNEWIDFSVYQLCPAVPDGAIQAVWATVIGTSCQSSVSIGDVVLVWDTRGCWFNVPVELLANFTGRADLAAAEPGQEVLFCAVTYSLEPCYWKVTSLCCSEESY